MMKTPTKFIALLSGVALLTSSAFAVETTPVGYITSTVYGNSGSGNRLTLISPSFHNGSAVAGTVTTEGASSLIVSAAMSAGAYDGGLYYVEVIDSNGVGYWTDIVSNTTDTLTVNDDLTSFIADGDSFNVRQHLTLGGLFGDNDAGLTAGFGVGDSDTIQIVSFNGGVSTTLTYYYSTFPGFEGWRDATLADSSGVVIAPHEGLIITRRSSGDLSVVFTGEVRSNDVNFPLETGLNIFSVPSAATKTLATSGLASVLAPGFGLGDSDNVQIIASNGDTLSYYYSTFPGFEGWRDASLTDSSDVALEPGTSFIVTRAGAAVNVAMSSTLPQPQ